MGATALHLSKKYSSLFDSKLPVCKAIINYECYFKKKQTSSGTGDSSFNKTMMQIFSSSCNVPKLSFIEDIQDKERTIF